MEKWRLSQVTWPLKSECSCLDTTEEYLYSEFSVYQPALGHRLTQQRYRHQSIMFILHNFQLKEHRQIHPLTPLANMQIKQDTHWHVLQTHPLVLSPQLCFTKKFTCNISKKLGKYFTESIILACHAGKTRAFDRIVKYQSATQYPARKEQNTSTHNYKYRLLQMPQD